jgi:signal transduction histidine kinase
MNNSAAQSRRLLLVGFGGLLLLIAFTGLNAVSVLKKIETRNESIRQDYVNRDRIVQQLRSDIYLSGTYVRDLLLEPNPALADIHRSELETARVRIQSMLAAYRHILRGEEREPFLEFANAVQTYFDSLRPALQWDPKQRRALGYAFMKNSLLPRRMVIVQLADQIGRLNEKQMENGNQKVRELFASFRKSLVLLLVLALLCGTLLAGVSIQRVLRLERLSNARFEEIVQARGALRDLSARLLEVQEMERRSLSRELHDEVGQSLSALLLGIGNVAATISAESDAGAREQLQDIRRLAEKTVAVVRDMSLLLRPSMLDDLGLLPALEWQAREVSRTTKLRVDVRADSISEDLPDEYKTCIYRIVQEALRNVTRHAKARSVEVNLAQNVGGLRLTIQDDGQGFFPEKQKGIGLLGMKERALHLYGSFHVDSEPGKGTRIDVELPFFDPSAKA